MRITGRDDIVNYTVQGRIEPLRRQLQIIHRESGMFENAFIATAESDSRIICSAVDGVEGLRYRSDIFAANIDGSLAGDLVFGKVTLSPATKKHIVLVTAALRENGRVVGILGLPLDLEAMSEKNLDGTAQ